MGVGWRNSFGNVIFGAISLFVFLGIKSGNRLDIPCLVLEFRGGNHSEWCRCIHLLLKANSHPIPTHPSRMVWWELSI
jgi:hypothetical protein